MSELRRLETFSALVRLGTLAEVAATTAYSTSAVSQQVARLEADFGVALVERDGRRLRLTTAGRRLAELAPALVENWESVRALVLESVGETRGDVVLAGFQSAYLSAMPDTVSKLAEAAPLVRVRCRQAEPDAALPGLLAREVDVAIVERYSGQSAAPSVEVLETVLAEDPMYVAVPAELGREVASVADLRNVPWVMEPVGSPVREWAERTCRSAGFDPVIRHDTPDLLVQCELVRRGIAAAFIPNLLPNRYRADVQLLALPHSDARTISAVTRVSTAHDPAIRAVIDGLTAAFDASASSAT